MDSVEAKRNLDKLYSDKKNLEALNHLNSTHQFKQSCLGRIRQIKQQIHNIQQNLG